MTPQEVSAIMMAIEFGFKGCERGDNLNKVLEDARNIYAPAPDDYAVREGDIQCLWQGAHSRCTLRLGHYASGIAHKESH